MPEPENIPGFDAIGIRVSLDEPERFTHFLKTVWGASTDYQPLHGDCGEVSGEYYRLWTHILDQKISHVLESNPLPGLVVNVENFVDENTVKIWIWDPSNSQAEAPLFPMCATSPLPWFREEKDCVEKTASVSVSVLASDAQFFDDEASFKQHPELNRFATQSFIPTGLFAQEGESIPHSVFLVGNVILAVKSTNDISGDEFHALRVRTLGGELWVNLPEEAVTEDVTGKIVAVQGLASAFFPDWTPAPKAKAADLDSEKFSLQGDQVEGKLRELCVQYFKSEKFQLEYFSDIHVGRIVRALALVLGIFISGARGLGKKRGKASNKLAKRYLKAAEEAPIVMARIVMANTMVLYSGQSSPALVVIAFGEGAEEAMDKAHPLLARIHFGDSQTEEERQLAREIEDEDYRFGKRRRLPAWLVGNVEAYAADLWIPSIAAHEHGLMSEVLVCLAEPGPNGLTAAIPAPLIEAALEASHGPAA